MLNTLKAVRWWMSEWMQQLKVTSGRSRGCLIFPSELRPSPPRLRWYRRGGRSLWGDCTGTPSARGSSWPSPPSIPHHSMPGGCNSKTRSGGPHLVLAAKILLIFTNIRIWKLFTSLSCGKVMITAVLFGNIVLRLLRLSDSTDGLDRKSNFSSLVALTLKQLILELP